MVLPVSKPLPVVSPAALSFFCGGLSPPRPLSFTASLLHGLFPPRPLSSTASLLHSLSPPRPLFSTASLLHDLSLQAPDQCCDDPAWLCGKSLEILNTSDGGYSIPVSPDASPLGCDSIRSQWRLRGFYRRPVHWRRLQRPWSFLKNIHELGHGGSL